MDHLTIRSRFREYQVDVRDDQLWANELSDVRNAFYVVDELVWNLHGTGCLSPIAGRPLHLVAATEDTKTLDGIAKLCDQLTASGVTRTSTIISVGGGVIQDATGFLASVLYRGLSWIYVPSTLLAQADSCIGSKTSLNHHHVKNLLGTIYPPRQIVVHPPLAATVSDDHFFSGLGEIVKMHVVAGPEAVASLEPRMAALCRRDPVAVSEAVFASLLIKRQFIEEDEFDLGRRRLLNFGHCFGHALETATDFAVPHGQAVTLGIVLAGLVSTSRGRLKRSRLDELGARLLIPTLTSAANVDNLASRAVIDAMRHDKKRSGKGLAVVLPLDDGGLVLAEDVTEAEALQALEHLPDALRTARQRPS